MTKPDPIFIPEVPVRANARLEKIKDGPEPTWEVFVWGEPPHDSRRTYTIKAKDDNTAAFEGIRQFVEEMSNLDGADVGGD